MDSVWLKDVDETGFESVFYFEINKEKFSIRATIDENIMEIFFEDEGLFAKIEGDMWHLEWSIEMFRVKQIRDMDGDFFDLEEESQLYIEQIEKERLELDDNEDSGFEDVEGEYYDAPENFVYQEEDEQEDIVSENVNVEVVFDTFSVPVFNQDPDSMCNKILDLSLSPMSVPDSRYEEYVVYDNPEEELGEEIFEDYFEYNEEEFKILEAKEDVHLVANKMSVGRFFRYLLRKFGRERYSHTVFQMLSTFLSSVNYNGTLRCFIFEGANYLYGYAPKHFKISEVFRQWVTYFWITFLNRSDSQWGFLEKNLLMNVWKNLQSYYEDGARYMFKYDIGYQEFELCGLRNRILSDVGYIFPLDEYEVAILSRNLQLVSLCIRDEASCRVIREIYDNEFYKGVYLSTCARQLLQREGYDSFWIREFLVDNYAWILKRPRCDEVYVLDCFLPEEVVLNEN
jgi:hypothetical protein